MDAGKITAEKDETARKIIGQKIKSKLYLVEQKLNMFGSGYTLKNSYDPSGNKLSSKNDYTAGDYTILSNITTNSGSTQTTGNTSTNPASTASSITLNPGMYGSGDNTTRLQLFNDHTCSGSMYISGTWQAQTQGTYSIVGNMLTISYTSGTLAGQRFQYTITSNKSFAGGGETWTAYF
jgi:hypothetical protein